MALSHRPVSSSSASAVTPHQYNPEMATTIATIPHLFNYSLVQQQKNTFGPITTVSSSSPEYYHTAAETGKGKAGKSGKSSGGVQLGPAQQLFRPSLPYPVMPGLSTQSSPGTYSPQPPSQSGGYPAIQNPSRLEPLQPPLIYRANNDGKSGLGENPAALNENQLAYLHHIQSIYQRQEETGPIPRPWWMWGIGYIDVASAVWSTVWVVYNILFKPISDPENYIWKFFIGFLAILARLLQGVGLIIGLKSGDDSSTLWYCKVWFACQLMFVTSSVLQIFYNVVYYSTSVNHGDLLPPVALVTVGLFLFRVVSLILVRIYIGKLKESENRYLTSLRESLRESQREQERAEEERFGTGETSFCGPSIALIMSL